MNKISSRHYIFLLLSVSTIALRSYSSIFISDGGHNTWLLVTIAYLITLFIAILFFKKYIKLELYDFYSLLTYITPKIIGKILLLLFCFGLYLNAIEATATQTNSIHINFFINTPIWYCLIFFLIPSTYAISRNFNTIVITCIVTVTLVLIGDIIYLILIAKYIDFSNLLPILKNIQLKNSLLCIIKLIGASSCIFITLPFIHYITDSKKLILNATLAIIITIFLISTALISVIGFYGYENAQNIYYPEYILCQQIEIGDFFEFGEFFYIFRNVCLWFLKYIICSMGILFAFKDKIKNKTIFISIYTVTVFIASMILANNQLYLFDMLNYLQYTNILTFLVVPVISLILIKNNKLNANA